jgi:hypothetical protein
MVTIQEVIQGNPGAPASVRHELMETQLASSGPAVVQSLFLNLATPSVLATILIVPPPVATAKVPLAPLHAGDLPVPVIEAAGAERPSAYAAPVEVPRGAVAMAVVFGSDPPPARADLGPAAPPEAVGSPADPDEPAPQDVRTALPMVADLIADALPVDRDQIAAAVDRFLEPLADLGDDLARAEGPVSWTTEVLLVAGALGGLELARRRLRRGRSHAEPGLEGRSGSLSSPELPGAWSASRP